GLLDAIVVVLRGDGVLVERAGKNVRDEAGPHAGVAAVEMPGARRPAVEVADDGDFARVRRPDREVGAMHAILFDEMGAEFVVDAIMVALAEEIEVEISQERRHVRSFPVWPHGVGVSAWRSVRYIDADELTI